MAMSEMPITRREAIGGIAGLVLAGCAGIPQSSSVEETLPEGHPAKSTYESGMSHLQQGNWGMARSDFDLAIAIDDKQSLPYFRRAQSYLNSSKIRWEIYLRTHDEEERGNAESLMRKAESDLLKAVELDDNVPDYHAFLGLAYVYLRERPKALKAFDRAVELLDKQGKMRFGPSRFAPLDEKRIRETRKEVADRYRRDT